MPTFKSKTKGVTELGTTVNGRRYRFAFPYTTDNFTEMAVLLDNDCEEVSRPEPAHAKTKELAERVQAEEGDA